MTNLLRKSFYKFYPILNIIKEHFHTSQISYNFKKDETRQKLFAPVQIEKFKKLRKVSIIGGSGMVGQAVSFNLLLRRICDEIVLVDLPEGKKKLCAETLDFLHGSAHLDMPVIRIDTDNSNTYDSDIVYVSAGVTIKPGQSRLDVVNSNVDLYRTLIPPLASLSPNAIFIIVSNPVDIMTYAAWRFSGFPQYRVIGTGTELDSARFRFLIGRRLGISPLSVNALVIGEHGDSSVPIWSTANVAGTRLKEINNVIGRDVDPECWFLHHKQVVHSGGFITATKGTSNVGVAITSAVVMEAILKNKKTVHTVSTYCKGVHGLKTDVFLSLPCVLGNRGVEQIIKQKLDPTEMRKLHESAKILNNCKDSIQWDLNAPPLKVEKKKKDKCS